MGIFGKANINVLDSTKNLEKLLLRDILGDTKMIPLYLKQMKNLQKLYLQSSNIHDILLEEISRNSPQLKHLSVYGFYLTDSGVENVVKILTSLKAFHIISGRSLTNRITSFIASNLTSLEFV